MENSKKDDFYQTNQQESKFDEIYFFNQEFRRMKYNTKEMISAIQEIKNKIIRKEK